MAGRGDGYLTISWAKPAQKGSDITGYTVRVTDTETGAVRQAQTTAPSQTVRVSGLTNNHAHSVQVRARNKAGLGPYGSPVKMQSAGNPRPVAAPTVEPRAPGSYTTNQVKISWSGTDPNGPALTRYTVYKRAGSGPWGKVTDTQPGTRSATTSLPYDGQQYSFVVTATNGASKESTKSNPRSYTSVAPPLTPNRPTVRTPNPDKRASVVVRLNDSRGGPYTSLQWRTSRGGAGGVSCGCPENSSKSFTIGGVGISSQTLQVRVSNGQHWSSWSAPSNSFQPYGSPNPPKARSSVTNGKSITFRWSAPTFNGRKIVAYQITGAGGTSNVGAGTTQVTRTYGRYSTTYRVSVKAKDSTGAWSTGTTLSGRTGAKPEPPPPSKPITNLHPGGRKSDCGNCYDILWSAPGVPNGTYTMKCYRGGRRGAFYTGTASVSGGQRSGGYCSLDPNLSKKARIVLIGGGGTYDSTLVTWWP
jgi:hypothetical protein